MSPMEGVANDRRRTIDEQVRKYSTVSPQSILSTVAYRSLPYKVDYFKNIA